MYVLSIAFLVAITLTQEGAAKQDGISSDAVDDGFSEWSSFNPCSHSCGGGVHFRTRTCTNPLPENGGECIGPVRESGLCNTEPCPIDGGFGPWSNYSDCSTSCGFSVQTRSRKCDNPKPQHGGKDCDGARKQTKKCDAKPPCAVDGKFGPWTSWEVCSVSCGGGISSRSRNCDSPAPKNGGKNCTGSTVETNTCNSQGCPVDGGYGSWSGFSVCTKTCGRGTRTRSRKCDTPAPQNGGNDCSRLGPATEVQTCNTNNCPPKVGVACEHKYLSIRCGHGSRIRIEYANYGRRSRRYCGGENHPNTNCGASNSWSYVYSRCQGRQSCYLKSNNSEFGDPCHGTYKYLEVRYRCV